jgi:ferredoxin
MSKTVYISLTEDELLLLDGRSRPEVQKEVNTIKTYRARVAGGMPEYLAKIVTKAESEGILEWHQGRRDTCSRCKAPGTIHPVYKIGKKKGQINKNKKVIELVRMRLVDQYFCHACWPTVKGEIAALDNLLYEVHISDIPNKAIRDHKTKCVECGFIYWETDLPENIKVCPGCGKIQSWQNTRKLDEWRIVEIAALKAARILMRNSDGSPA